VLVDGNRGQIVFWPTAEQIAEAEAYEKQKAQKTAVTTVAPTPARLPNGEAVTLWANLDNPMQIPHVLAQGLNGVGLFRTEFLVLGRRAIPDEETQTQIYTDVVRALEGRRLTIRTFDLGGDKEAPTLEECSGQNPALGVRGLRRHLQYRNAELITQLKAIMRAAHHGPVSILLPMVTNARDIHAFKELFEAARDALAATSHSFDAEIPLGAMIEVPSSALNVEKIMRRVDFISIGTNDLMQYVTAADRDNTVVLGYHDLKCSGTEKLIEWIMETAGRLGRVEDVSLCGDLASRPSGAQDLVQLGLRSLSIFPAAAPAIRRALESQQPQTQQPQTQKPPETQALENQQPQNQKPPETQK
jgi:phosphotransferase system enzyme I (PtsI)